MSRTVAGWQGWASQRHRIIERGPLKASAEKERDLKKITSEAYKTAQEIKGTADAESTRIFAEAFNRDPEFYSFMKTLELYGDALDKNSELILSTDSDFFKYLKGYSDTP